jgi:hydrogenase expression/formation protein HypC
MGVHEFRSAPPDGGAGIAFASSDKELRLKRFFVDRKPERQEETHMCLGVPGQIVTISDAANSLGIVDVSGIRREINLVCIVDEDHPLERCVGDWVLVHVGFAMSRIDAEEAAKTLSVLEELGEMQRELEAMTVSESA